MLPLSVILEPGNVKRGRRKTIMKVQMSGIFPEFIYKVAIRNLCSNRFKVYHACQ